MLRTVYLLLMMLVIVSCRNRELPHDTEPQGVYVGLAPCTHCRGVYSKVVFEQDGTVKIFSSEEQSEAMAQKGKWILEGSLIKVALGRDTLMYRSALPDSIISLYRDRQNPLNYIESYVLKKHHP